MTMDQSAGRGSNASPNADGDSSRFADLGSITIHYLDFGSGEPPLVLLHGLSANANEFSGLINAGLGSRFRVVAPDLRGRGRSDKPAKGYSMGDHAADVIGLLDFLELDKVVIGGHSFGALLAMYMAATFPHRVSKVVVIDAAIQMHPQVRELIKPSLDRLGQILPSVDDYMSRMRAAPHVAGFWDKAIECYFRAEIQENADGTAQSLTSASAIAQALDGVQQESWAELVSQVKQPVLLLNAVGEYGPSGSPPVVPAEHAIETARAFADCKYVEIPGNHLTMVFGESAVLVRREIESFVGGNGNL
jgi:pimeloyl-ACP methyl ester carboxylesterase